MSSRMEEDASMGCACAGRLIWRRRLGRVGVGSWARAGATRVADQSSRTRLRTLFIACLPIFSCRRPEVHSGSSAPVVKDAAFPYACRVDEDREEPIPTSEE